MGREIPPKDEHESQKVLLDLNLSTDSPRLTSRSNHNSDIDQPERQSSPVTVAEVAAEVVQEHGSPRETSVRALSIAAINDGHESQPGSFARNFSHCPPYTRKNVTSMYKKIVELCRLRAVFLQYWTSPWDERPSNQKWSLLSLNWLLMVRFGH